MAFCFNARKNCLSKVKVLLTQVEGKQGKKWKHVQTDTYTHTQNWPEITEYLGNVFLSRTIFFCTLNRLKYLVWVGRKKISISQL